MAAMWLGKAMADTDLKTIQTAIEARLKSEMSYLKAVGPLGDVLAKNLPDEYLILCPSVHVTFYSGSFRKVGVSSDLHDNTLTWHFFVIGRSYVSTVKLLQGSGSTKGIYEILDDLYECMNGTDLSLGIWPFTPGELVQEHLDKNVAIYSWLFTTERRV